MERPVSVSEKIAAASAGAFFTSLVTTPYDVIKTRLQANTVVAGYPNETPVSFRGSTALLDTRIVRNTREGIVRIAKFEGFNALWRGLPSTLLIALPSTVIYYLGYEHFKDRLALMADQRAIDRKFTDPAIPFAAGTVSRIVAATLISPMEMIRTRQQSGLGGKSLASATLGVVSLVKRVGPASLWRGLTPTLWRDVPFSGLYWMGYEYLYGFIGNLGSQAIANGRNQDKDIYQLCHNPKFWHSFVAGALSGTVAATVTTPFDVAKTLRQVEYHDVAGRNVTITNDVGTIGLLKSVYRKEGLSGLFKGLSARLIKVGPACAIMISSYEFGKVYFSS